MKENKNTCEHEKKYIHENEMKTYENAVLNRDRHCETSMFITKQQ